MPTDTSEKQLETILVDYLRDIHKYEQGASDDYNKNYALDPERVKRGDAEGKG
jgi:type I restriction enzyme R subunit